MSPSSWVRACSAALAVLLLTATAFSQQGDARATKLAREAMEEDYLATNMDAAVAKLNKALSGCAGKCSATVVAQLYGHLGTVYAAGLAKPADAVNAFKKMLEADPKAKPDPSYLTGDVQKAFDDARSSSGPGPAGPTTPTSRAKLIEDPWKEQAVFHPIPVYVELPDELEASTVSVRYRAPGGKDWKETALKRHGEGWGGNIPCTETQRPGKLAYFVSAFDTNLDRIASSGSAGTPHVVELKETIGSRQPALPDEVPPSPCPRPVDALSCDTDDDCPGDQVCASLSCVDSSERPPKSTEGEAKKNWLSITFSPDLLFVDSADNACSRGTQAEGKLSCFYSGGVPYTGEPIPTGSTNTVRGGVGVGSMRVMLGYDRVLGTRMTAGARLGMAFLGYPKRADGTAFLPFHAEARFAFHFSNDPFSRSGVRPYLFANGGLAEASARVTTSVIDDSSPEAFKLDVFQRAGPGFAGAGFGIHYAVAPEAAMVLEVAGRAMLPEFGVVIAPTLGFAYGM